MPKPSDFYATADAAYVVLDEPYAFNWRTENGELVGRSGETIMGRVVPVGERYLAEITGMPSVPDVYKQADAARIVESRWLEKASLAELSNHLLSYGDHTEARLNWFVGHSRAGNAGTDRTPLPLAPWQTRLLSALAGLLPGRMLIGEHVGARGRHVVMLKEMGSLDRPLRWLTSILPPQGEIEFKRSLAERKDIVERDWLLREIRLTAKYCILQRANATASRIDTSRAIVDLVALSPQEREQAASRLAGPVIDHIDLLVGREIRRTQPQAWAFAAGGVVADQARETVR